MRSPRSLQPQEPLLPSVAKEPIDVTKRSLRGRTNELKKPSRRLHAEPTPLLPFDFPASPIFKQRPATEGPIVLRHLAPAVVSEVYDTYWRFAAERQSIFFRRTRGTPPPWTTDPVLATYKFTNAYRASD